MPSFWPCRSGQYSASDALAAHMQPACWCTSARHVLHQVSWLLDRSLQSTSAVGTCLSVQVHCCWSALPAGPGQ